MYSIRPYTAADWALICAIHDRARPDELRGSCDPRAFVPLAIDPTAEDIYHSRKWVACGADQVVGFVGIAGSYLSWLYVDPDWYGRGIGRGLLRFALGQLGPDAWTVALEGNAAARHLYRSAGFQVVRTFHANNAGYSCTCVRLALNPPAEPA